MGVQRRIVAAAAVAVGLMGPAGVASASTTPTPPFAQCPADGLDTSCALLVYVTSNGQVGVAGDPSQVPFDGTEDTLIGVQNNSPTPLSSLPLASNDGSVLFGFDGDGLCNQLGSANGQPSGCPFGATGYEGPGVSFANINSTATAGTVVFSPAVPPGGSAYFSLEEALPTQPPFDIVPGPPNTGTGMVTTAPFQTNASETAMAVDPTNPQHLFVAFNYRLGPQGIHCGYEYTTDGGKNWSPVNFLLSPPKTIGIFGGGDPSVAFNSNGDLYFSCLASPDTATSISTAPPQLYAAIWPHGASGFGPSRMLVQGNVNSVEPDQEQLAPGPSGGQMYMCYTLYKNQLNTSSIWVATLGAQAGKGGQTPYVVNRANVDAGTGQAQPVGCTVSVGSSGRVWAAWWDAAGPGQTITTDKHAFEAYVAHSDSQAAPGSFSGVTALGPKRGITSGGSLPGAAFYPQRRVYIAASPALGDDRAVAVWEDNPSGADNVMQSEYSGGSWSAPSVLVPKATQPSVVWGADGTVLYGFYANPNLDGGALSYSVGATTDPALAPTLTPAGGGVSTELAAINPFSRFADYEAVAEGSGESWAAFTDDSVGGQNVDVGHLP